MTIIVNMTLNGIEEELNRLKWKAIEMARTYGRPYIIISFPRDDPNPEYRLLALDGLAVDIRKIYIEWFANKWCDPTELKQIGVLW
jgi:hypothetical protein